MISRKLLELRYSDTDQMGVIYHANYFTYFELGRTQMLKEHGIDYYKIEQEGYIFPVRDVGCTYLKSIRLGEVIYCDTEIVEMTKVKIRFEHRLVDEQGEVKAKGHSTIICVDKSTFKIAKFDKHIPSIYKIKESL